MGLGKAAGKQTRSKRSGDEGLIREVVPEELDKRGV
jgi:hypothetical protein